MPSLKKINLKGIDYTLDFLPLDGGILAGAVRIHNNTPSEGVTSGALVLTGGLGVSGAIHANTLTSVEPVTVPAPTGDGHAVNLKYLRENYLSASGGNIAGVVNFTDTTAATSVTTGAVRIAGGLGVSGAIFASSLTSVNPITIPNPTANGHAVNLTYLKANYLPLTGGTVTGAVAFIAGTDSSSTTTGTIKVTGGIGATGKIYASSVIGAVWNDFAEYRIGDMSAPGRCVCEVGDDTVKQSTRRLQPGAMIVSDTFGFAIGETDEAKTPVAVAGRVLAYPYEAREDFANAIGHFVCAGPNGTVSLMTSDEVKDCPEAVVGSVSAVPDYEEWGTGKVKVNGRVWIKIS